MAAINEKLELVKQARDGIQTALAEKGQIVGTDIRDYAEAISQITTSEDLEAELSAQEQLINQLKVAINSKTAYKDGVKLFDTVEHMQQDQGAQEGDLAVVYRDELQPVIEESEFDSCIFSNTVVLEEAFTGSIYGSFRAVDQSVMFDGMVEMSSSSFRFDGYGESSEIRVEYESQDGITYTRTDGGEELQEFGTAIKWEDYGQGFNSVIGNFMKISGNYFEGLYKYILNYEDKSKIHFLLQEGLNINSGSYITINPDGWDNTYYDVNTLINLSNKITEDFNVSGYEGGYRPNFIINEGELCFIMKANSYIFGSTIFIDSNYNIIGLYSNSTTLNDTIYLYRVTDIGTGTYTLKNTFTGVSLSGNRSYVMIPDIQSTVIGVPKGDSRKIVAMTDVGTWNGSNITGFKEIKDLNVYKHSDTYAVARTQLDTTSEYVYDKVFYGKNGLETGDLGNVISSNFNDVIAEVFSKAQTYYDSLESIQVGNQIRPDTNIRTVPVKSDGTPLIVFTTPMLYDIFQGCSKLVSITYLDTSNATAFNGCFSDCASLVNIPVFDTHITTQMTNMFSNCPKLSNDSLNNIMMMCINADNENYGEVKTLEALGLTQEQAQICETLSNYQDFVNAGWSTGY